METTVDFEFENHGSICLLRPITAAGQDWIREHIDPLNSYRWAGAVAIEPRFALDILAGINEDGLGVA